MKTIKIVHLYPREMNIYGDNGNIQVLRQRLHWRNINCNIIGVGVGEAIPSDVHILVGGGGQDAGQLLITRDLQQKAQQIKSLADNNIPMLMVCGMYQMFGNYFKTISEDKIPGIGVMNIITEAKNGRLIGNVVEETYWGTVVGYENHSGRTYLGDSVLPLGKAPKHTGNNGEDNTEGAIYNNVIGTYLHGPILAKAPLLADHLINQALEIAGISKELLPLSDELERISAMVAKSRPR